MPGWMSLTSTSTVMSILPLTPNLQMISHVNEQNSAQHDTTPNNQPKTTEQRQYYNGELNDQNPFSVPHHHTHSDWETDKKKKEDEQEWSNE